MGNPSARLLALTVAAGASGCAAESPATAGLGAGEPQALGAIDGVAGATDDTASALEATAAHSRTQVCARWLAAKTEAVSSPALGATSDCDPGALPPRASKSVVDRLNTFRWLAGLGPVTHDATMDQHAQACANLEAWFDWEHAASTGANPHDPPSTTKCYTTEGAATAGQSNLAFGYFFGAGVGVASGIDFLMQDPGNESTMGHRRWFLNPPLDPIGVGYWAGGQFGVNDAMCVRVFGTSGTGPSPRFVAMPPGGPVPVEITAWPWTLHGDGAANAVVTVADAKTGASLAVTVTPLPGGYGQDTVAFTPDGWTPKAGGAYRVVATGLPGGDARYVVKPVACR
jgi:hypothetical protein